MRDIRVWIDDLRPMPAGYDVQFRRADLAMSFIKHHWYYIDLISFDHDAGDYRDCGGGDYIKVLDWIEFVSEEFDRPVEFKLHFHTGNPVGLANMERIAARNEWTVVEDDTIWDNEGYMP